MTNKKNPYQIFLKDSFTRRVSVVTSLKGSVTVEASMAVPLFFFAVVCLLYLMEMMAIGTSVRAGLQAAGKVAAYEYYPAAVIMPARLETDVVNAIGADRLDRSIVMGGSSGIDCGKSYMSMRTGIGELCAEYKVQIPVPFFRMQGIVCNETMKIKSWVGYEKEGLNSGDDQIVYLAENGLVYHKDYHCTHLDLSIRMEQSENVGNLRNSDGGKYYPCAFCNASNSGKVYLTESGNRYHGSLSCSGLKRTIYAVPMSEVIGKGACQRCGS